MRSELLFNPRLLCERLAIASIRKRRLAELKGTPAAVLTLGHIDTMELVKLARDAGVKIVYDVGANVGTWSLLAKSLIPTAIVHAFEPLAEHQARFYDNLLLGRVTDVTLHTVALGAGNTTATMHITDFSDASSLLRPNDTSASHFGVKEVRQVPLQVYRLDDYRRSQRLPWPDLLKLDIQGYELEALRGAPECLAATRAVIAEVSFIPYYEQQCLFHDLVHHLAEAGLFLTALGSGTPTGRPMGQTDALFVRMGHAELKP